jgi:hypothetical protein
MQLAAGACRKASACAEAPVGLPEQARARKVDAASKLEQLQRDIGELSSLSPEDVEAEEAAIAAIEEVRQKDVLPLCNCSVCHQSPQDVGQDPAHAAVLSSESSQSCTLHSAQA